MSVILRCTFKNFSQLCLWAASYNSQCFMITCLLGWLSLLQAALLVQDKDSHGRLRHIFDNNFVSTFLALSPAGICSPCILSPLSTQPESKFLVCKFKECLYWARMFQGRLDFQGQLLVHFGDDSASCTEPFCFY